MNYRNLILFIIFFLPFNLFAQAVQDTFMLDGKQKQLNMKIPEGHEFLLCFMKNYQDNSSQNKEEVLTLELFITGDFDANVTVEIKGIRFKEELFIPANTVRSLKLDPKAQITSSETIEKGMAVHITSDKPISVYGLSTRHETTDTYLGLPINVIGKEYRVMCYQKAGPQMPQFAVVATEDDTEIEITPRVDTKLGKKANLPFLLKLDKGDVYQVVPESEKTRNQDLTGSYIKSNKNISVFSGHQCAYVPAPPPLILACNHLAEQIPPISSWGKHFFIGRFEKRSNYTYRVLAHSPHTKVFINSKLRSILQPGQFFEGISDSTMQITADKPILVAQYSQGFRNGDLIGDPMMLLISPTQQFLKQYRFATPINGFWNHYINVVVPSNAINTLKLNGKNVDSTIFKQIGLSRYSIAHISVDFGTHYITSSEPFGMYSYGFGFADDAYDAYGTMGGQSFIEYIDLPDTLKPTLDIENNKDGLGLIARDDRINDSGIKNIEQIEKQGLDIFIKDWDEGTPQAPISIKVNSANIEQFGRVILLIEDMQGNESVYTVCYDPFVDIATNKFILSEGVEDDCNQKSSYYFGLLGKFSTFIHNASFNEMDQLSAQSDFSNASGFGGYFGIEVSRQLNDIIHFSARVSYEKFGGKISSPDTIIQAARNPVNGQLTDFQEAYDLELDGGYLGLSFAAQAYFTKNLYFTSGLAASFAIFDSPKLTRRITYPANFVYANESNVKELNDIRISDDFNSVSPSIFIGLGFKVRTFRWLDAFAETNYNYFLNSFNSSGDWNISNVSLLVGLKINSEVFLK